MGRASAQAPRAGPHKVYAQTRALSSRTGAFCAQNGGLRGAAGRLCRQGDEGVWTRTHGQVHVRSRFGNALLRRGRWAYPWICSGSAPFAARVRAPAVHASATPCSAARALAGYAPWHDGLASAHTPRAIKRLSSRALAALPAARALASERFALMGTPPAPPLRATNHPSLRSPPMPPPSPPRHANAADLSVRRTVHMSMQLFTNSRSLRARATSASSLVLTKRTPPLSRQRGSPARSVHS